MFEFCLGPTTCTSITSACVIWWVDHAGLNLTHTFRPGFDSSSTNQPVSQRVNIKYQLSKVGNLISNSANIHTHTIQTLGTIGVTDASQQHAVNGSTSARHAGTRSADIHHVHVFSLLLLLNIQIRWWPFSMNVWSCFSLTDGLWSNFASIGSLFSWIASVK